MVIGESEGIHFCVAVTVFSKIHSDLANKPDQQLHQRLQQQRQQLLLLLPLLHLNHLTQIAHRPEERMDIVFVSFYYQESSQDHQKSSFLVFDAIPDVKQCPPILEAYSKRKNDPEYVKYIRQSNANCNYASQAVCCTDEEASPPTQPTTPSTTAAPVEIVTPSPEVPDTSSPLRLLLPSEGCGISKVPHNRVVGGVPAKKGGWPWMTLIGYKNSLGEISFKCGGSIITKRHVLTGKVELINF